MQFITSVGKLMEVVWKVATKGHIEGSRGIHNKTREDARANGVKRMSQRKFDKGY